MSFQRHFRWLPGEAIAIPAQQESTGFADRLASTGRPALVVTSGSVSGSVGHE
jgi:hypothetical protein